MVDRSRPVALVTGFEPFGGDPLNPSWMVAEWLHGQHVAGHRVQAVQLPTTFEGSIPALRAALRRHQPSLVLALGQAGRTAIGVERVAINLIDARIADNAGAQPIDEPVWPGAPAAHFATLPVKAMVRAMRRGGLPAEQSFTAGSFVCNQVFFGLMQLLRRRPGVRGGFVHVPMLPEQAREHGLGEGLALGRMQQGVKLALAAALRRTVDLKVGEGRLD